MPLKSVRSYLPIGKLKVLRGLWRIVLVAIAIFVLALLIVGITPQGRVAAKTMAFLPQVLPGIPVRPLEWVTDDPIRQEVTYPLESGAGVADLYSPNSDGEHGAVLLFLGVNPAGRDDPRVVGLAEALARSGVVVMIPWSENMTQRRVDVQEIDNLVRGFQFLGSLDNVDADKMGMAGFCVGASLTVVAAQDQRISGDVRFVNFFGGYFNAEDLIRSVVTRNRFYDESFETWHPNSLSVEVVSSHLIEGISSGQERRLLSGVFLGGVSPLNGEADGLSAEAKAVYSLLSGPEYSEVDDLLNNIPARTRESLATISPSTGIDRLRAKMLIMHDRQDDLVPSEESLRFVEALADNGDTYYTEFSFFQHVDPTRPVSPPVFLREGFKLFLHMFNIMRELS